MVEKLSSEYVSELVKIIKNVDDFSGKITSKNRSGNLY